jgi:hypothetical protein
MQPENIAVVPPVRVYAVFMDPVANGGRYVQVCGCEFVNAFLDWGWSAASLVCLHVASGDRRDNGRRMHAVPGRVILDIFRSVVSINLRWLWKCIMIHILK